MTVKSFEVMCSEQQCHIWLVRSQPVLLDLISSKPSLLVVELSHMLKNEYSCVICLVLVLEPVSYVLFSW